MKNWVKILLPIIGIAYCIAFLEIDFPGGVQQTFHDPYDTYVVVQNNTCFHPENLSINLNSPNLAILCSKSVDPIVVISLFLLFTPLFILLYSSFTIYLKNCTFLV